MEGPKKRFLVLVCEAIRRKYYSIRTKGVIKGDANVILRIRVVKRVRKLIDDIIMRSSLVKVFHLYSALGLEYQGTLIFLPPLPYKYLSF